MRSIYLHRAFQPGDTEREAFSHKPLFFLNAMKNLLFSLLLLAFFSQQGCRTTPNGTTGTPTPGPALDTATTFRNPILPVGPDPWVVYDKGFYYVMHTTGNDLRIYKTAKMSLLGTSTYRSVWSPPGTPATRDVWAPELHRINNKWYIYYAAVVAPATTHRMWVLENEAADPLTGTWVSRGQVRLPDDEWAIDGTSVVLGGQQYYAWSGWPSEANRLQNIYLCKMKDPWTAEGPRVLVSTPQHDWERQTTPGGPIVNEGPEFLIHNDKVFLIYSASFCGTDAYALGLLTANLTANLTDASSWQKADKPVFGPSMANGAYGVGHNGFFQTPDGKEHWIVYHANAQANQGCADLRSVRMQRFTWNPDGTPNFGTPIPLTEKIKRPSGE
jgi:GH43 family beta-xylosidase